MPQVNLLPAEYRARRGQRRLFTSVLAAGGLLLALLGVLTILQRKTLSDRQDELRREQARTAQLREQVEALRPFGTLQQQRDSTRAALLSALSGDVAFSRFLNDLAIVLPDDSWIVALTVSAGAGTAPNGVPAVGNVTMQGFVFDFPGLAGWLTRMSQLDGLTFVYPTTGSRQDLGNVKVISFGANASLTSSVLSQRCAEGKPCP